METGQIAGRKVAVDAFEEDEGWAWRVRIDDEPDEAAIRLLTGLHDTQAEAMTQGWVVARERVERLNRIARGETPD